MIRYHTDTDGFICVSSKRVFQGYIREEGEVWACYDDYKRPLARCLVGRGGRMRFYWCRGYGNRAEAAAALCSKQGLTHIGPSPTESPAGGP